MPDLVNGRPLAAHHELIVSKCQEVADSDVPRYVILLMPPGSAKSTYTSKAFPAWYLGRKPGNCILACSYSKDLATTFGRAGRNYVDLFSTVLGYTLSSDSRAADEWETSTGGRYFCAGVGSGIAGHRADLGLIDDYLGNQEDADSEVVRQRQWEWFLNDFWPRLKPNASIIIIANRRHTDDLVGRLTRTEENNSPVRPEQWEVIKLPYFAEDNDPIARAPGERLWSGWFTERMDAQIARLPRRVRAGLYQQSPQDTEGNYFKLSWLKGYEPQDLPKELQVYGASDHACSEKVKGESRSATVLGFGGWDGQKMWILPECWWEFADTGEVVKAMLRYGLRMHPLTWWAEKGHISKSIGPFLRDQMQEQHIHLRIEEVVPVRDKTVRARSAQGMCEFGQVMFPKFAPWWARAEEELLSFPGGRSDDWVDMLAHLCAGVNRMVTPHREQAVETENINGLVKPYTLGDLRRSNRWHERQRAYAMADR